MKIAWGREAVAIFIIILFKLYCLAYCFLKQEILFGQCFAVNIFKTREYDLT